jgi:hypothetical protein
MRFSKNNFISTPSVSKWLSLENRVSLITACSIGWWWFVLREEYCWLVAGGWFVLREKYCWLVADKPSEQGYASCMSCMHMRLCVTLHCSSSLLHVFSSPGKVTNHPFQQFGKNVSPQNVDHFSINVVEYFFEINIGRHFYCVGNVDWVISSWISKFFRTKIWNWTWTL